jgi:hypothetical protein
MIEFSDDEDTKIEHLVDYVDQLINEDSTSEVEGKLSKRLDQLKLQHLAPRDFQNTRDNIFLIDEVVNPLNRDLENRSGMINENEIKIAQSTIDEDFEELSSNSDDTEKDGKTVYKTRNLKEKIEILDYLKTHSLHKTSKEFNVDRKSLKLWKSKEEELRLQTNKKFKKSLHKGRKPQTCDEHEDLIKDWVDEQIQSNVAISTTNIIIFASGLDSSPLKNKTTEAKLKWAYRFLERHQYSIRRTTHIGQQIPSNSMDLVIKFLKEVIRIRKKLNFELKDIINCDETPVCLDNPNSLSIAQRGAKIVPCKTFNKEKYRITALLTIASNGEKLKPYLIFKGEKWKDVYKELQTFDVLKTNKLVCVTQQNSWIDEELFLDYIQKVLQHYGKGRRKLLIMDHCKAHFSEMINFWLKQYKYSVILIPKELTKILQPLDRGINGPFKRALKFLFTEELIKNKEKVKESINDARLRIIENVNRIWNEKSTDYITSEGIINSFKVTGISNEMSGLEDSMFDGYDLVEKFLANNKTREEEAPRQEDQINEEEKLNQMDTDGENSLDEMIEEENSNIKLF